MQRKSKIIVVVTRMDLGGVPEHIVLLLKRLSDRYDCTLTCREILDEHRTRLEPAGVKIILIDLARTPSPLRDLRALVRLAIMIRRGKFDIVHSHMSKGAMIGGLAGRLAGAPLVLNTAHNLGWLALTNPLARRLFWIYDKLLFALTLDRLVMVSQTREEQIVRAGLIGPDRVETIMNGIDADDLRSKASTGVDRKDLNVPDNALLIVTVARYVWFKAIDRLIEAVSLLGDAARNCRFVVIGDGEQGPALQRMIAQRGLEDRVTLLGPRLDVPRILALADLFVLPSVSEGMPIAIMEAMALGLPVVATAVGGVPELVVDGETGLLVPPRDPAALADAIRRVIDDEGDRKRLGEAGRARVRTFFTDAVMAQRTDDLYRRLQGTKDGRGHHAVT